MLYAFFDIFLVMYLANEIKISSDRLSYCLFESNWADQSGTYQKCVIMMCEILRKPQEMVILFYPMNLQTFSMVSILENLTNGSSEKKKLFADHQRSIYNV